MGYISQYPPAHNDTYVKATTRINTALEPFFATDPAKSLIGAQDNNAWMASTNSNQRFHIDLGSAKIIEKIYYENTHVSGANTSIGAKSYILQGSNSNADFIDLVYANDGTWTTIQSGLQFDQHIASNIADPKYQTIINSTAYRYYAIKIADNWGNGTFLGLRRIELQIEEGAVEEQDTLALSDQIELNVSLEKLELADTLNLSDDLRFEQEEQESEDTTSLSDEIELLLTKQKEEQDTLILSDELEISVSVDAFDTLTISDEIATYAVETTRSYINNSFGMVGEVLSDVDNKISIVEEIISDITNDIRFLKSWQIAGDAGYQSLGKTYVKIYINDAEQTDAIIDSISITKLLNSSHTASFDLGRPYDNTKPDQESEVEIKYHTWTLYKGYITQITPTDNPEKIKIICQNEYWKQNKTKKYFQVGHRPLDNFELYYNTISSALSNQFNWNPGIGSFVPQTMNCFGVGSSDCINNLIQNSGNYAWYYDYNKVKKLWIAGQGSIINLEKQEIGKNLGLYQILNHSFGEDIGNIVNKYRVQMGDWVWRRFSDTGASRKYPTYSYWIGQVATSPVWNSTYERLGKDSDDGYGFFHHPVSQNKYYNDVFTKYTLPFLNPKLASWTDRFPPTVEILIPFGSWLVSYIKYKTEAERLLVGNLLTEGFTIDYENGYLIFNEPIYLYQLNDYGEISAIRKPDIRLLLSKKEYYSNTEDPSDDPTTDISNPLMFFTDKMGDYHETIMDNLELSQFNIQIGYSYKDDEGDWHTIPSWNDSAFALDYANWQLSKTCDKKITGTVDLTLDAICFYDIDLTKRIKISGVMDTPLNILSMTYNISNWRVSLNLQNNRYYNRTTSLQSHGE